jgi:hypothetical protein
VTTGTRVATLRRVTPEVAEALTRPVVSAALAVVILLVLVAGDAVGSVETTAHEGGHMVVAFLTGRRVEYFELDEKRGGATRFADPGWGPGRILLWIAGYATPPLLGLAAAALLVAGNAWPLLWTAVALLLLAWVKARGEGATGVTVLVAAAIAYVALYGSPVLQAAFAAGLVWLLLIGGSRAAVLHDWRNDESDAAKLAQDTFVPRVVWYAAFVAVALYCLLKGTRLLLNI